MWVSPFGSACRPDGRSAHVKRLTGWVMLIVLVRGPERSPACLKVSLQKKQLSLRGRQGTGPTVSPALHVQAYPASDVRQGALSLPD